MSALPDEIVKLFKNFSRAHILVLGDLILDTYIWGEVNRISPEAPVPIVSVNRREDRLGGAGNVASNLASLGARVTAVGVTGSDVQGAKISTLFNASGIENIIAEISQRKTTVKTRVIAQHQQLLRIDEEVTNDIDSSQLLPIIEKINSSRDKFNGLIISDYGKGMINREIISSLIEIFSGKPIVVDPKGYDYRKYSRVTAIKPNFKEFCALVHQPDMKTDDMRFYAEKVVDDLEIDGIVVTMGEHGVFVLDKDKNSEVIPTRAKEVYDVSGAGDTFIAAFTTGLVLSGDWLLAAKAGNFAAGVVVGKIGTATVTVDEILSKNNLI